MPYNYRDSGEYPVEQGQVWQVGNHLFVCSDVATDSLFHELYAEHQPDVLYADPPWSNGLAKQFRTLTDLPPPPYEWQAIWEGILRLAPAAPRWLVGDRYREPEVTAMLTQPFHQRWALPGFTSPTVIGVLHYDGSVPVPQGAFFTGANDERLPGQILDLYPQGGMICDACSGLGITSRSAEKLGWRSINNELAPVRMGTALRRMEKKLRVKPERVR